MLSARIALLALLMTVFAVFGRVLVFDGSVLQVKKIGETSIIPHSSNFTLRFHKSKQCDSIKKFDICYAATSTSTTSTPYDCGMDFVRLTFQREYDSIVINEIRVRYGNNDFVDCLIQSGKQVTCENKVVLRRSDAGQFIMDDMGSVKIKVLKFDKNCPASILGAFLHVGSTMTPKKDEEVDEKAKENAELSNDEDQEEDVLKNSISIWWIAVFLFLSALLIVGIGFGIWGVRLYLQHKSEQKSHNTPPSIPTKTPKNAVPVTAVTDPTGGIGPEDTLIPPSLDSPKPRKPHKDSKGKQPQPQQPKPNNITSESKDCSEMTKLPPSSVAAPSSNNGPEKKRNRALGNVKQKPK